jgi:hypothetical protein
MRLRILALLVMLSNLLYGCRAQPVSPTTSPLQVSPIESYNLTPTAGSISKSEPMALEPGLAGIEGVIAVGNEWGDQQVVVYASPFYSAQSEEQGFFILEPSIHPSTKLMPSGEFQLVNIEPGSYVLVVGPNPDEALAIQESGTPKVFRVDEDQVLDIGYVDLP